MDSNISDHSKGSGIVSRLRGRSASASRRNGRSRSGSILSRMTNNKNKDEQDPSEQQIDDIIERNRRALKKEMIGLLKTQKNETRFWKKKAIKLKKDVSLNRSPEEELQDTTSTEDDRVTNDAENKLLKEKLSALEIEAAARGELIDSLRQMMVLQETAGEERVKLLEHQLERLVEMNTRVASDDASNDVSNQLQLDLGKTKDKTEDKDAAYEIVSLEQLLARVLAEKDKLLFENQNMKSILQGGDPASLASNINSPKEYQVRFEENVPPVKGMGPRRQSDSNLSAHNEQRAHNEKKPKSEQIAIPYQMYCKMRPKNHRHIKYRGVYYGNKAESQQEALKKMLEDHFYHVWKMSLDGEGSLSSSVHADEWHSKESGSAAIAFQSSSLARHIANHCQPFSSREDVSKWCKDNVKVEVRQGPDTQLPSTEKKKSKGFKKHMKRRNSMEGGTRPEVRP